MRSAGYSRPYLLFLSFFLSLFLCFFSVDLVLPTPFLTAPCWLAAPLGRLLQVLTKTTGLNNTCERLLAEQQQLRAQVDQIRAPLEYFNELERIGPLLGVPIHMEPGEGSRGGEPVLDGHSDLTVNIAPTSIKVHPGSDQFLDVLKRIEANLSYFDSHPEFREGPLYFSKMSQLHTRALAMVKLQIVETITTAAQGAKVASQKELRKLQLSSSASSSSSSSYSASNADATAIAARSGGSAAAAMLLKSGAGGEFVGQCRHDDHHHQRESSGALRNGRRLHQVSVDAGALERARGSALRAVALRVHPAEPRPAAAPPARAAAAAAAAAPRARRRGGTSSAAASAANSDSAAALAPTAGGGGGGGHEKEEDHDEEEDAARAAAALAFDRGHAVGYAAQLLEECFQVYFTARLGLLRPAVTAHLREVSREQGIMGLARIGSSYLARLCRLERQLFVSLLPRESSVALASASNSSSTLAVVPVKGGGAADGRGEAVAGVSGCSKTTGCRSCWWRFAPRSTPPCARS